MASGSYSRAVKVDGNPSLRWYANWKTDGATLIGMQPDVQKGARRKAERQGENIAERNSGTFGSKDMQRPRIGQTRYGRTRGQPLPGTAT